MRMEGTWILLDIAMPPGRSGLDIRRDLVELPGRRPCSCRACTPRSNSASRVHEGKAPPVTSPNRAWRRS